MLLSRRMGQTAHGSAAILVAAGVLIAGGCRDSSPDRAEAQLQSLQGADVSGRVALEKVDAQTRMTLDAEHTQPGPLTVALVSATCEGLRTEIADGRTSRDAREAVTPMPHEHLGTFVLSGGGSTHSELMLGDATIIQRASRLRRAFVFYRGVPGEVRAPQPIQACADLPGEQG